MISIPPVPLLVLMPLDADRTARIAAAGFAPLVASAPDARRDAIRDSAPLMRAVLTNGASGLTAAEIAALPHLEIICAIGVGYENIDVAAARARGIVLTHGRGTNAVPVADHAMALMLGIARGVAEADAAVRRGDWLKARAPRPSITGKRLGIVGLGEIGLEIAQRAAGGFGMQVAYHNRREREACAYPWMLSVQALAAWCDFLMIATPGGAGTRHLVDSAALAALGPSGFLINIGRGSVIDQPALITALQQGRIAGAALDVVDGEPVVPPEFTALGNVIITPHIGGRAPEAVQATAALVIENLRAHFSGKPLLTPIP